MLPKNKLSIKPHEVRGKEHVSAIFKRFRERDTAKENS
jgi:heterodisulfide reductase subunit C